MQIEFARTDATYCWHCFALEVEHRRMFASHEIRDRLWYIERIAEGEANSTIAEQK